MSAHLAWSPIKSLIHIADTEYALFEHKRRDSWVLETYCYDIPGGQAEDMCNSLHRERRIVRSKSAGVAGGVR